ncbi:arsenate reductase ArsC [Aquimarina sp. MMG016]|uniref:arsenate reductase ArsC n=1 Tax=Aquimarina sp. MMG016 TaxID=2822690 RepID=UPI001B3A1D26|nr:arsenate reductase ArsC [Aquimarina sp. MMG016]MBQ4818934.1 arsenate reductase ArsC [Aquimarina sp. MMG016]
MNILVLCTGNSCRSQMAEGYLKHFAKDNAAIYSAGVETHGVNPRAISIMKEDGIDISNHTSNNLEEYLDINFDYILTVCDNAKERCPFFPGKAKRLHYNFFDPSKVEDTEEEIHQAFTKTRNQIKEYCKGFVEREVLKTVS